MNRKVTEKIVCAGVSDREIDLFEGQYRVPEGMTYNSYVILDDKTAVMDTVDQRKSGEWMKNLQEILKGEAPDYLILQHMEPDHSGSLGDFLEQYPETTVVGNSKTFGMISMYFPDLEIGSRLEVKDGDTLNLGKRELKFFFAPMVHWPEVMLTYDKFSRVLFSADAFGRFGDDDPLKEWDREARRYYFGIVAKYGMQVQSVLKKVSQEKIEKICPLHGPVLECPDRYLALYDLWSSYRPEKEGICICYTSVYGHTKEATTLLAELLKKEGIPTVCHDLARCDFHEAVADAFCYDSMVLASTTYNGTVFPFMKNFLDALTERGYRNRRVALIENGSWAPLAARIMKGVLDGCKDLVFAENIVTVKGALGENSMKAVRALAAELQGKDDAGA